MEKTSNFEELIKKIKKEEDDNGYMHYYLWSATVNQLLAEASASYFADDETQELVLIYERTIIRIKNSGQFLYSKPDGSIGSVRLQISSIIQEGVKVYEPHYNTKICGSTIL